MRGSDHTARRVNALDTKKKFDLIEESDRGCVIVGAAILEQYLVDDITSEFRRNGLSSRYIQSSFDGNGPLATLSSKILIARGFGLIDDNILHDLMLVRKLRNEFAHSPSSASFDDASVKAKIKSLFFFDAVKLLMANTKIYNFIDIEGVDKTEVVKDWHASAAGYHRLHKVVFCLIVKQIELEISRFRLRRTMIEHRVTEADMKGPDSF